MKNYNCFYNLTVLSFIINIFLCGIWIINTQVKLELGYDWNLYFSIVLQTFLLLSVTKVIIENNEFFCKIIFADSVKTLTLLIATEFKSHKFVSVFP